MKNEIKKAIDQYIGKEQVFNKKDRENILQKITKDQNSIYQRKSHILKLSLTFVAIVVLAFVFTHIYYSEQITKSNENRNNSNELNELIKNENIPQIKQEEEQFKKPTDEQILQKVKFIQENLKIGMTKKEVSKKFGYNYLLTNDVKTGNYEVWIYKYFENPNYKSTVDLDLKNTDMLDDKKFKTRNIGVKLVIMFNKKGNVNFAEYSYVLGSDNTIYIVTYKSNGDIEKQTYMSSGQWVTYSHYLSLDDA